MHVVRKLQQELRAGAVALQLFANEEALVAQDGSVQALWNLDPWAGVLAGLQEQRLVRAWVGGSAGGAVCRSRGWIVACSTCKHTRVHVH